MLGMKNPVSAEIVPILFPFTFTNLGFPVFENSNSNFFIHELAPLPNWYSSKSVKYFFQSTSGFLKSSNPTK